MSVKRILVVEDDPQVAEVVVHCLQKDGYDVVHAGDGRTGLDCFKSHTPALVVLDLNLPKLSGKALFTEMRTREPNCPVIMLTCRSEAVDRIEGLEMGADDYICKPFVARELVARIRNVLHRSQRPPAAGRVIQAGAVRIDTASISFSFHGSPVTLTRQEFELMKTLAKTPSQTFTRDQLITAMHEEGYPVTDRTVDSCIKRIRRKLQPIAPGDDPIETCYGFGYRFRQNAPVNT